MASHPASASSVGPTRTLAVVLVMLALTALLGQQALTQPESLAVRALLLAVLVAETRAALAPLHRWGPRLVGLPLSVLLAGMILLTTAQAPAPDAGPTRTVVVTGGVLGNQHEANQDIQVNNSGCSGAQKLALQQQVRAVGGEVAFETPGTADELGRPSTKTSTWGGGLWVGRQVINAQPVPDLNNRYAITSRDTTFRPTLFDLHIYRQIHRENGWRSIDARFGLHLGQLGYFSYFGDGESRESAVLMPEFMVRMGKPSVLFGQADFCYGAENVLGAYTSRLGLGSGLGISNGPQLLVGYAHSPHQPSPGMGFASALLRLPGHPNFSLEPYYATDLSRHNSLSLKLNYRIGR